MTRSRHYAPPGKSLTKIRVLSLFNVHYGRCLSRMLQYLTKHGHRSVQNRVTNRCFQRRATLPLPEESLLATGGATFITCTWPSSDKKMI